MLSDPANAKFCLDNADRRLSFGDLIEDTVFHAPEAAAVELNGVGVGARALATGKPA